MICFLLYVSDPWIQRIGSGKEKFFLWELRQDITYFSTLKLAPQLFYQAGNDVTKLMGSLYM